MLDFSAPVCLTSVSLGARLSVGLSALRFCPMPVPGAGGDASTVISLSELGGEPSLPRPAWRGEATLRANFFITFDITAGDLS